MTALPKRKYTIEEYVELLKTSEERFEYFDGELFSMAGGKFAHAEISCNALNVLRNRLVSRSCRAYNGELAIKVPTAPPFRFPDTSVVCGTPIIEEFQGIDLLVNPILIVEVLSDSTNSYDLNEKFVGYQSIESFQEYLAIAQKRAHVIHHRRQADGLWLRHDIIGLESSVYLESINVTLTLQEIYENVNFPDSQPPVTIQ
ncbi:MAG: Uma2 family endonuclease [Acidobacteria bacterium]|nr:Uma2 family endonuclease [Acidobacteriota bacterium]